jgi:hypothetical protein
MVRSLRVGAERLNCADARHGAGGTIISRSDVLRGQSWEVAKCVLRAARRASE